MIAKRTETRDVLNDQFNALNLARQQEAALWGMQNSQQMSQQMSNQMSGLQAQMENLFGKDPLQGVEDRNVPYWQAMYGNLGMDGRHFRGGK